MNEKNTEGHPDTLFKNHNAPIKNVTTALQTVSQGNLVMREISTGEGYFRIQIQSISSNLEGDPDSNLKPHLHLPALLLVLGRIQIFGSSCLSITDDYHTTVYTNQLCDKHVFVDISIGDLILESFFTSEIMHLTCQIISEIL